MPLRVVSFVAYLTRTDEPWRDADYHASKFIKAIKGDEVNGYANIPVSGATRRLDASTAAMARGWAAEIVAGWMAKNGPGGTFVLVPLPPSNCTVRQPTRGCQHDVADAVCQSLGRRTAVWDVLRFRRATVKARDGGDRDPETLYGSLRLTQTPKNDVVLVDDVVTMGGHLQAARAILEGAGVSVLMALAVGRSVLVQKKRPFDVDDGLLDDWSPDV